MSESVLSAENQKMVADAHCWVAELQIRRDSEYHSERLRPFVMYKPRLFIDGNQWCALLGENLQDGVAGFGPSPSAASADFDANWNRPLGSKSE